MTCRDEILACINSMANPNREFTVEEIVDSMRAGGSRYAESTIRTHITSRMCANAPDNHAVTYQDLKRVGTGIYRLK